MSAHVLLNLLNELRKRDKLQGFSLFCNKFNKFNYTGARKLVYIYHMTLKLFSIHIFGLKALGFCHIRHFQNLNAWRFFTPRGDVI